ncbi:GspE/PulE family protein [Salinibacillus xinjiangensis]|uniref:Type II secretion system protein GspE n=1 Tax=Salinibacillus xinjiangensis TaxID=1229268 RepID=A0A6G1X909_9BACI|nr:ATPase, T2SS/T4P/T4SS family [Salinibacillus xinjiangensis]MRG87491.1 type II secretion system protein GspE [Salinibacillus xinjiangensis]
MPIKKNMRLGDLLVESSILTQEQLDEALQDKSTDQKLGDILVQKGFVTELQLIEVLEFQLGIPRVTLYNYPIDTSLLKMVPKEFARRNLVIPIKKEENKLFVAMADPMDYFVINDLRLSTGFTIEPFIATKDDIIRSVSKFYDVDDFAKDIVSTEQDDQGFDTTDVEDEDSPVVKLVNQLLQQAVVQQASDIHIDCQETKVHIRFRVDGKLRSERSLPKHVQGSLITRIKIMANLDITEQRVPQDGRIKLSLEHRQIDLRISTLPTIYGEKIVIRLLDLSMAQNDIDHIGFEQDNLEKFKKMIHQPHGIVLLTGPTGSGKSSTMYSALTHLNEESDNIITVEDPVEYQVEGINQIQVNPNVGLTFAAGLRAILRQDPDIIMIGEIRDKETADMAVRASITGHLVFSTLHTNNSLGTINRLKDMGVELFLIASSLNGVVSQRLVRKICRDCKQEKEPTEREKEIFAKYGVSVEKVYQGEGCPTCNMTGYRGRTAIHEVLVIDDHIRQALLNNESTIAIRDIAVENGLKFLIKDGIEKVKKGTTTTEEILRVALD